MHITLALGRMSNLVNHLVLIVWPWFASEREPLGESTYAEAVCMFTRYACIGKTWPLLLNACRACQVQLGHVCAVPACALRMCC